MALGGGEPAVVRHEEHRRALRQSQTIEGAQHPAHRLVHGLDHAGVDGVLLHLADLAAALSAPARLQAQPLLLAAVLLPEVLAAHQGGVHRVEGEVGQEGLVPVLLDEAHGLGGEAVGEVLPRGPVLQPRIAVGREVLVSAVGPPACPAAGVDVEAVVLGPGPLGAQVPLPGEEGRVAGLPQGLGQGQLLRGQAVLVGRRQVRGVAPPPVGLGGAEVVGGRGARGIPAGHDAAPGGAAHRAGRVGVGEAQAALGQGVAAGGLVEGAPVAGEVGPAQVVDQDEEEARALRRIGRGRPGRCRSEQQRHRCRPDDHAVAHPRPGIRLRLIRPQASSPGHSKARFGSRPAVPRILHALHVHQHGVRW